MQETPQNVNCCFCFTSQNKPSQQNLITQNYPSMIKSKSQYLSNYSTKYGKLTRQVDFGTVGGFNSITLQSGGVQQQSEKSQKIMTDIEEEQIQKSTIRMKTKNQLADQAIYSQKTEIKQIENNQRPMDKASIRLSEQDPIKSIPVSPIHNEEAIKFKMHQEFESAHFTLESGRREKQPSFSQSYFSKNPKPSQIDQTEEPRKQQSQKNNTDLNLISGVGVKSVKNTNSNNSKIDQSVNQSAIDKSNISSISQSKTKTIRYFPSGSLIKYPVPNYQRIFSITPHERKVSALALSPDCIFSASIDQTIKIIDKITGEVKNTLQGHQRSIVQLQYEPNSGILASASIDSTVILWKQGQQIGVLKGHSDSIKSIAFVDQQLLLSSSEDKTVILWEIQSGKLAECLQFPLPISHMVVNKNITFFAAGKFILVYSLPMLEQIKTFEAHSDEVCLQQIIQVKPNNMDIQDFLISTGKDGKIKIWEIENFRLLEEIQEECQITAITFIPEINCLVCGLTLTPDNAKITIWSLSTMKKIIILYENTTGVGELIWDSSVIQSQPNNKRFIGILYSGHDDKKVEAIEFYN